MPYQPQGVHFDGASDYLLRGADLTGNADSKVLSGAVWINTTTSANMRLAGSGGSDQFIWFINATLGNQEISAYDTTGNQDLKIRGSFNCIGSGWTHLAFSVNMNDVNDRYLLANGLDDLSNVLDYENDTLDLTKPDFGIGASTVGTQRFTGDMADFWLNFGTCVDLGDSSVLKKFYDEGAVDLGSDGSGPTGTPPLMYFSGDVASWHTNKGSGGGFTENGALTASATSPPIKGSGSSMLVGL